MADATSPQNPSNQIAYPLKDELQVIDYLRNITGGGSGNRGVGLLPNLSPEQMNAIMQQYMQGQGQFLQKMFATNQSGLYNSNTRNLMAGDLLGQAARQAALANVEIAKGNADIQRANAAAGAGSSPSRSRGQENLLLALMLQGGKSSGMWGKAQNWLGDKVSEAGTAIQEGLGITNYQPGDTNFVGPSVPSTEAGAFGGGGVSEDYLTSVFSGYDDMSWLNSAGDMSSGLGVTDYGMDSVDWSTADEIDWGSMAEAYN